MKKLLIIIMMSFALIVGTSNSVSAYETGDITWICDTDAGGTYFEGYGLIPFGVKTFSIELPKTLNTETYLHYFNSTYDNNFAIRLYNDTTLVSTLLNGGQQDVFTPTIDDLIFFSLTDEPATFIVHFESQPVPIEDGDVDNFKIRIPADNCGASLVTDVETSVYTYDFKTAPIGQLAWDLKLSLPLEGSTNYVDSYTSRLIEVPYGVETISFFDPLGFANDAPQDNGYVNYYNADKQLINTLVIQNQTTDLTWHDWYPGVDNGTDIDIGWSFYGYDLNDEIAYIQIIIYGYNDDQAVGGLKSFQDTYFIAFDDNVITINFNADGEVFQTIWGAVGATPQFGFETPDIEGKTFSHYLDSNGDIYERTAITDVMVSNDVANIYAVYLDDDDTIIIDVDDPETDGGIFETILDDTGFNDAKERVIVFAIVLLLVTIILFAMKVNASNVLIVDAIIVAFFVSLGLLPTIISAIIIIVLVLLGAGYFLYGGGGSNE